MCRHRPSGTSSTLHMAAALVPGAVLSAMRRVPPHMSMSTSWRISFRGIGFCANRTIWRHPIVPEAEHFVREFVFERGRIAFNFATCCSEVGRAGQRAALTSHEVAAPLLAPLHAPALPLHSSPVSCVAASTAGSSVLTAAEGGAVVYAHRHNLRTLDLVAHSAVCTVGWTIACALDQ